MSMQAWFETTNQQLLSKLNSMDDKLDLILELLNNQPVRHRDHDADLAEKLRQAGRKMDPDVRTFVDGYIEEQSRGMQ